ncbi:MAG: sulfite exporter TauE/SafE family protein [Betaproteobacteria bacterium]|nr:sulfite exporter TauE/SafE family protein [Betaproteobacteria bacterium]
MFSHWMPIQIGVYVLANLLLLLVACYLLGWNKPMARLEAWGGNPWRLISPLMHTMMPPRTWPRALSVGLLWGFMPCGLVYGALAMAMLSRSAMEGAAMMMMFGLGTLPNLLAAGALLRHVRKQGLDKVWRLASGVAIGGFGMYGLAHAAQLGEHISAGLLCLSSL